MMTKEQLAKLQIIMHDAEKDGRQPIIDLCKEIMCIEVMNEKIKSLKFNIYDYVAPKPIYRSAVRGVYHKNGEIVASNEHILVVLKNQEYNKYFEGKSVCEDGTIMDERYPNYNSIKPHKSTKVIKIDFNKFDAIVKEDKAKVKLMDKRERKNYYGVVKVGTDYLKLELLKKLVDFMKVIGTDEIRFQEDSIKNRYTCLVETEKGWGVMMLMMKPSWDYYEL